MTNNKGMGGFHDWYARCKYAGSGEHIRIDMDDFLKCAKEERAKADRHD